MGYRKYNEKSYKEKQPQSLIDLILIILGINKKNILN